MTSARKIFALTLFSKLVLLAALYNFFWILWELAFYKGFDAFIIYTLDKWILLIVFIVLSSILSTAASSSETRHFLSHIERGKPRERKNTSDTPEKEKQPERLPLY